MHMMRLLTAAALAAVAATAAQAADIQISVGGEVAPGVYGRVDIGTARPALVYPQPIIVTRPAPGAVVGGPMYVHVPPGHVKNWSKHCAKYNACGHEVYFVKSSEYAAPGDDGKKQKQGKGKEQ